MLKKIYILAIICFSLFCLQAKNYDVSASVKPYDEVYEQLLQIEKNIVNPAEMDLDERDGIRSEAYTIVQDFLTENSELDNETKSKLITKLEDIEELLYNLEAEKGNTDFGTNSVGEKYNEPVKSRRNWSGKGDILISLTSKTYGFPHGHAAILSTTENYVIEATPQYGVVHRSAYVYWTTVKDEGQYYVKGAPDSAYIKAVNYALNQVGEGYKLQTTLSNTSQWYCSKLVYKAWEHAGYKVGSLDAATGFVLPISIQVDWDTVKYKSNPYK